MWHEFSNCLSCSILACWQINVKSASRSRCVADYGNWTPGMLFNGDRKSSCISRWHQSPLVFLTAAAHWPEMYFHFAQLSCSHTILFRNVCRRTTCQRKHRGRAATGVNTGSPLYTQPERYHQSSVRKAFQKFSHLNQTFYQYDYGVGSWPALNIPAPLLCQCSAALEVEGTFSKQSTSDLPEVSEKSPNV